MSNKKGKLIPQKSKRQIKKKRERRGKAALQWRYSQSRFPGNKRTWWGRSHTQVGEKWSWWRRTKKNGGEREEVKFTRRSCVF